jgi:SAM-dependent methyltransferase
LERLTRACVDRARLAPGDRVLDIATGTGTAARQAARIVGATGAVTGIDISEQMVARATRYACRAAPQAGAPTAVPIRFERRDMEDSGAEPGAFDAVIVAFGLMYAADRQGAFAEIARVLAPAGRASVCVWGRGSACGWAQVFPIVDAHVNSEVCPHFFSLGVPDALRFGLERAGLVDVVEESLPVTLPWASADEACTAMLEGGPVALAWRRFSPGVRADVRDAYLASIEPYRRGSGYEVPSEIVFATARKPAP